MDGMRILRTVKGIESVVKTFQKRNLQARRSRCWVPPSVRTKTTSLYIIFWRIEGEGMSLSLLSDGQNYCIPKTEDSTKRADQKLISVNLKASILNRTRVNWIQQYVRRVHTSWPCNACSRNARLVRYLKTNVIHHTNSVKSKNHKIISLDVKNNPQTKTQNPHILTNYYVYS